MNPPVVLSVRLKGDWEGPQTGDVVLDVAQVLSDIHKTLTIRDENGIVLVYDGTQDQILDIYSKQKIDELTAFTSYTIVEKLPPVLDARTDMFYILPDGTINYIINNKWVNQATSLDIDEIVDEKVENIVNIKLESIKDKIVDLQDADTDLGKRIDQEIIDRKAEDKKLNDRIDSLATTDSQLRSDLLDEIQARKDGDAGLKTDLADEAKTRLDEDTKLAKNISDNRTAINDLNSDISDLDTKITTNANNILTTSTNLTNETTNRKAEDKKLQDQIDALKTSGSTSATEIANIKTSLTAAEKDIDDLQSQINKTVEQDISVVGDASTVKIEEIKVNLNTGTTSTESNPLPVASKTAAGVIIPATYKTIEDNAAAIDSILNGAVSIPTLPENPTQAQLTAAWKTATNKTELINGAKISDSVHNITYTYYTNVSKWEGVATGVTEINITTATNTTLGITKGDATTGGKIFVETDGSMSVNDWDKTQKAIKDNADNIATLRTSVQDNADDIADLTTKVTKNTTDIATNATNIATNKTNITTNATNITSLNTKVTTNETAISDLQDAVDALELGGGQTLYKAYGEKEDGALTQKFVSGQLNANNVILGKDAIRVESSDVEKGNVIIGSGAGSVALTESVTVLGSKAQGNNNSIAVGNKSNAGSANSVVLGNNASITADADNSVALGNSAKASRPYEVSVGDSTAETGKQFRFVSNVKAAELDNDAVNLKQMKDYVAASSSGVEILAVDEFKTQWSAA